MLPVPDRAGPETTEEGLAMGRMGRRLPRALALLVLLGLVGLAAEPGPGPTVARTVSAEPAPQLTLVRFGSPLSISDAGVFFGRARGYFQSQGIDVEILPFQSGPDLIP